MTAAVKSNSGFRLGLSGFATSCVGMTSTVEGLRALCTPSGYIHHGFDDLLMSTDKGCVLCREILNHVTGRGDAPFSRLRGWWKDSCKEDVVSIRGSFTFIPLEIFQKAWI